MALCWCSHRLCPLVSFTLSFVWGLPICFSLFPPKFHAPHSSHLIPPAQLALLCFSPRVSAPQSLISTLLTLIAQLPRMASQRART